jgi:hypothetical protein
MDKLWAARVGQADLEMSLAHNEAVRFWEKPNLCVSPLIVRLLNPWDEKWTNKHLTRQRAPHSTCCTI